MSLKLYFFKYVMLYLGLILILFLANVSNVFAQSNYKKSKFQLFVDSGVTKLENGEFNSALSFFKDGLNHAQEIKDKHWQSRFLFYAGLTEQRNAIQFEVYDKKREKFVKASRYYIKMLEIRPKSGPALNNLAKVQAELGNYDKAMKYFEKAISISDDKQGFYALNYSNFLKGIGQITDAERYAKLAVDQQHSNLEAHQALVDIYLYRQKIEKLLGYLWELIDRGAVNRVQQTVLDILEQKIPVRDKRESLIVLIAATLARQYYDPKNFQASEVGRRLISLKKQIDLSKPIQEILMLHQFRNDNFSWWKIQHSKSVPYANSGHKSFVELCRSLARWSRLSKISNGNDLAEYFYFVAINFYVEAVGAGSKDADPLPFLELADLYVNEGQKEKIQELKNKYESRLYHGKADAYNEYHRRKDNRYWYRIYVFHSALGFMYAHVGQWKNPRTHYASALFQLHHALIAAQEYNRYSMINRQIRVPPQTPALLSKAYIETGELQQGIEIAINYAEQYLKNGKLDQAIEVLKYIQELQEPISVSRDLIQRYQIIIEKIQIIKPITMTVAPPRPIKLQYPFLRGKDVQLLQRALLLNGFEVDVDGVFGKKSEYALKEFQRNEGLPVTGKTDAETRSRLGLD